MPALIQHAQTGTIVEPNRLGHLQLTTRRSLATSAAFTHIVPQDSQSGQIVVGVCCQTMKRAFVHFVSPFFRSRSSASALASADGLGNKPSNIMSRHRALQMLNCHWTRAKCFATRWASFIDDKNSRHRSVTMHTGSMRRLGTQGITALSLANQRHTCSTYPRCRWRVSRTNRIQISS